MLICSRNETTSVTEAAIRVTPLVESRTIHCHSRFICLLHQIGELNGDTLESLLLHFQVLGGGTNLCSPSRDVVWLLINYVPK